MGRMKWSRANVVDPSPGVFFHQPPKGRMGGFATAGSMHADRVKALLLFGGAPSSVHRRRRFAQERLYKGGVRDP